MSTSAEKAKRWAQWIVAYLSLSPFLVALVLATHVYPSSPFAHRARKQCFCARALVWFGCGVLGIIGVVLLSLRPIYGFVAVVIFTVLYEPTSVAIWHQPIMLHYWLPLAVMGLATYGVFVGKEQKSLREG